MSEDEDECKEVVITEENDDRYRTIESKFEDVETYCVTFDRAIWDFDILNVRSGVIRLHLKEEWKKRPDSEEKKEVC